MLAEYNSVKNPDVNKEENLKGEPQDGEGENSPTSGRLLQLAPFKTPHPPHAMSRKREQARRAKEPLLSQQFPAKTPGYELRILSQPEEQHRARYLTEGSRGSVKNRNGQAFPVVKLFGQVQEATLQVFIGCDSGRVRPHGFYQACKVCGKNSTACTEKDIDGTTVIEIDMKTNNEMTASIDCVGILKLRNADVEQRIGIAKAKKKSTKARMVFRVTFRKACGSPQILQVASSPILCTQPIGQPEICKMSLKECAFTGGEELYIIGKNFLRGTQVFFQEVADDDGKVLWEKDGDIDKDYFQATHMIVTVPEYGGSGQVSRKVNCQVVVHSGGKVSEPQPFMFTQVDQASVAIKQETAMDTSEESRKRNYPFVAPEALELNNQIQQTQQGSKTPDVFQLPPGLISGVMDPAETSYAPIEESSSPLDGTGTFPTPTQPMSLESFTAATAGEALTSDSFLMTKTSLGHDIIDMTQTTTWTSKHLNDDMNVETDVHNSDTDTNSFSVLNQQNVTNEYEDNSLDSCASRTKNPRLSSDVEMSDHDVTNSTKATVSEFLKSLSYTQHPTTAYLNSLLAQPFSISQPHANTILTQSANRLISSVAQSSTTNPASVCHEKFVAPVDNSILKGVLTCPARSLENLNFESYLTNRQANTVDLTGPDTETSTMDMTLGHAEAVFNLKPPENVMSPIQNKALELGHDQMVAFSPDQVVPSQSPSPFSPSDVLVSLNQIQAESNLNKEASRQLLSPDQDSSVSQQSPSFISPPQTIHSSNASSYIKDQLSKMIASSAANNAAVSYEQQDLNQQTVQCEGQNNQNLASYPQSPVNYVSQPPSPANFASQLQSPANLVIPPPSPASFASHPQSPASFTSHPQSPASFVSHPSPANIPSHPQSPVDPANIQPHSPFIQTSEGQQFLLQNQVFSQPNQVQTQSAPQMVTASQVLQALQLSLAQSQSPVLPTNGLLQNTVLQSLQAHQQKNNLQTYAPTTTPYTLVQSPTTGSAATSAFSQTKSVQQAAVTQMQLIQQLLNNRLAQQHQQLQQQQQQPVVTQAPPQHQPVLQVPSQPVLQAQSDPGMPESPGSQNMNASLDQASNQFIVPSTTSINPMATQIIICNPSSQQNNNVVPNLGSAPSIVIVPGQANNQVENLLRSILGSIMPQSQSQPQQQQQQQVQQQQQPPPQ